MAQHWHEARFGDVRVQSRNGEHEFTVEVHLGGLDLEAIRVELFADQGDDGEPSRHVMTRGRPLGALGGAAHEYSASVPDSRPSSDYVPRLVPHHPAARTPLEANEILWQR